MLYLPQSLSTSETINWPALRIISQRAGLQEVLVSELMYLRGAQNYSWLHCRDGRQLLVPYTLKRMTSQLPEPSFVRLHRSYVVNRSFVDRVETHPTSNHCLFMICGDSIPVARRHWVRIRQQLGLVKKTDAGLLTI